MTSSQTRPTGLIRYHLLKISKSKILFIPPPNSEAGMMESALFNLLSLQIEKLRAGQVNLLNYVKLSKLKQQISNKIENRIQIFDSQISALSKGSLHFSFQCGMTVVLVVVRGMGVGVTLLSLLESIMKLAVQLLFLSTSYVPNFFCPQHSTRFRMATY